jgi:hypothetical protein
LEDLDVDGKRIFKRITGRCRDVVYWDLLAKDRYQWWTLFIVVVCFQIDKRRLISCIAERLFSYRRVTALYSKFAVESVNTIDRLCGLVVRVLGHRSGGPGSIPGTTREKT